MASDIADALGIGRPDVSKGSSVDSKFLDRIHAAKTDDTSYGGDAYRKAERVLHDFGLTYDPFWDTSESADTGGSTVTNRAYSRIRSALLQTPRCFILNTTDAEVGARWETDHHRRYRYDNNVTGRRPLNDAGPGSRVIFYATSKSSEHPKHFIARAEISYIGPGWEGPWEAAISGYTTLNRPVPEAELELAGWNHQHAITEITFQTYLDLLEAAHSSNTETESQVEQDPGGDVTAQRITQETPAATAPPAITIPATLPGGPFQVSPVAPAYTENVPGIKFTNTHYLPTPSNTARNKLAETRAVTLVHSAVTAQGWTLDRDCQKEGVGFDLLYVQDDRELHVEVKGIISDTLAFNLTPKEAWRVETDQQFVVIVVTNVLSPRAFELHLLTRERLARGHWVTSSYRVNI